MCHHTHDTTHLPPQAYTLVAPWFHCTGTNPTVAWDPGHDPQCLSSMTPTWPRPDPTVIAICCGMYESGRTGEDTHAYYLLHHSCHTAELLLQTLTCQRFSPDTAYILRYIYSYLKQIQQGEVFRAVSPRVKHIISEGVGIYVGLILQLMTPVAHLTTGLAIYAYLPKNPCLLPQPSPADLIFFFHHSGKFALFPITAGATLQLTYTEGQYSIGHY